MVLLVVLLLVLVVALGFAVVGVVGATIVDAALPFIL